MQHERASYFRALLASTTVRSYWTGPSPDDPEQSWYFETIEDRGEVVAVRQVSVSGERVLGYSVEHLEDEEGFLTDRAVEPRAWGLDETGAAAFEHAWDRRGNR